MQNEQRSLQPFITVTKALGARPALGPCAMLCARKLGASTSNLQHAEPPHLAAQLLLGFFAHAAGVEQDEISRFGLGHLGQTGAAQHLGDAIGIVLIHLAAKGDDREVLHANPCG
jgi:hypothetical protein